MQGQSVLDIEVIEQNDSVWAAPLSIQFLSNVAFLVYHTIFGTISQRTSERGEKHTCCSVSVHPRVLFVRSPLIFPFPYIPMRGRTYSRGTMATYIRASTHAPVWRRTFQTLHAGSCQTASTHAPRVEANCIRPHTAFKDECSNSRPCVGRTNMIMSGS